MTVRRLIEELHRRVPDGAPFDTRWKAIARVVVPGGSYEAAVAARIDRQGRRREQFWCDGVRVERPVLLRLTCSETECPQAMQVRAQWLARRRGVAAPASAEPLQARPLMAEVPVIVGEQHFVARPARFPCFTPCPNGAHPPLTVEKTGFDLFEMGACLGGGVAERNGVRRPRIPTLAAAEAFVLARRLEALAALDAARESSRRPDAPPAAPA